MEYCAVSEFHKRYFSFISSTSCSVALFFSFFLYFFFFLQIQIIIWTEKLTQWPAQHARNLSSFELIFFLCAFRHRSKISEEPFHSYSAYIERPKDILCPYLFRLKFIGIRVSVTQFYSWERSQTLWYNAVYCVLGHLHFILDVGKDILDSGKHCVSSRTASKIIGFSLSLIPCLRRIWTFKIDSQNAQQINWLLLYV